MIRLKATLGALNRRKLSRFCAFPRADTLIRLVSQGRAPCRQHMGWLRKPTLRQKRETGATLEERAERLMWRGRRGWALVRWSLLGKTHALTTS